MKAVRIVGHRRIEIVDAPLPKLGPGEVQVRLERGCLCGSDIPFFGYDLERQLAEKNRNVSGVVKYSGGAAVYPLQVGVSLHECVGQVSATRSERFKEGDFVLGLPFGHGGFLEIQTLPESRVFPLPRDRVSMEEILMAQPLGTILYGLRLIPEVSGKRVAVVGQGPIGLLLNRILKLKGASQVAGLDRLPGRLEVSPKMGANIVHLVTSKSTPESIRAALGFEPDLVVEAVGHEELATELCISLVKQEGTIFHFGVTDHEYVDRYPLGRAFYKNLVIAHSVGAKDAADFLAAADLIASGEFDVSPLITHTFAFDEAQQAYETFVDRKDGALKVIIRCD